jgi:hypothetical protein
MLFWAKKLSLKRGVRQGDLLSSYLFILASDFITRWCLKLQHSLALITLFVGVRPYILYVDDLLFILKPAIKKHADSQVAIEILGDDLWSSN